jgi:hypothetical protein
MRVRDFSATEKVQIGDVTFEVGAIPAGKWRVLCLIGADGIRNATRRALTRAREELGDAAYDALSDKEREEVLQRFRREDPEFIDASERMQRQALAWGVRGHSGPEGTPAFEPAEREWQGRRYQGASDAMVDIYADNPGILADLYIRISELNGLSVAQKKSSLPAEPSTGGGGAASRA